MTVWGIVASAISNTTLRPFEVRATTPVGGGSINESYRFEGTDGTRYFLKLNDSRHLAMFAAEAMGLKAIAATNTIRVPLPITHGSAGGQSYLVLEHLELSSRGDAKLLGEQLASLHRCTSEKTNEKPNASSSHPTCRERTNEGAEGGTRSREAPSCFGFAQDNFIGTTPQPNGWKDNWIDFWREERLGFQLNLAAQNGYGGRLQRLGEKLMDSLPAFFAGYLPQPSLLHGDLWSGNHAFLADGTPTVFDPAAYYGDRECDLAMTELFGGYGTDFYAAYRATYPLDPGYATRRELYNLYHILNHANLFGGGYARQAEQMTETLLTTLR
jgi:protein-ribulosamine 3-kinase